MVEWLNRYWVDGKQSGFEVINNVIRRKEKGERQERERAREREREREREEEKEMKGRQLR